ncbi:MAG TPA: AraC family transcriptional regulator [Puia sp.]|jgi:AraC-like DNA-binding protein
MHEKCEKYFPMHVHSKGQLSFVEGGLAYVRVPDRIFVIPPRHYFWIPAGLEHDLTVGHHATHLRSLFFYTHDDSKHEFYNKIGIYPINELLVQMIKFSEGWDGQVTADDERFIFLKAIKNLLPKISTHLLSVAFPSTDNKRMLEILDYIESNLAEPLSIDNVASKFGLSDRSLSRFFQSTLKISFKQYVILLRMAKAFELIARNEYSLEEIAYLTGYQSLSSFSNTFRQFTNFRPSDLTAFDQ